MDFGAVPARRATRSWSARAASWRRSLGEAGSSKSTATRSSRDDDRIADADGRMPAALRNDADWAYFQAELDRADWVAHRPGEPRGDAQPKGRRRLVAFAHRARARAARRRLVVEPAVGWPGRTSRRASRPQAARLPCPAGRRRSMFSWNSASRRSICRASAASPCLAAAACSARCEAGATANELLRRGAASRTASRDRPGGGRYADALESPTARCLIRRKSSGRQCGSADVDDDSLPAAAPHKTAQEREIRNRRFSATPPQCEKIP